MVENHNKNFAEQLKARNDEFQKLQASSGKQLGDLQNNFQEQQKQRQTDMESYKKEIAAMYEKNLRSAINEETSSLKVNLEMMKQENGRLNQKLEYSVTDYAKIITAFILALIMGFVMAKLT
ncbi:hypothetical protein [Chryseobacterium foetidum]|uniref:hypothetical protein n=1 Tax=Chryseobacterium foetidum TaxID=2951057 RepID=UPI0021CA7E35|nr:hypothetical protein [Chryseobacterium foetidum]